MVPAVEQKATPAPAQPIARNEARAARRPLKAVPTARIARPPERPRQRMIVHASAATSRVVRPVVLQHSVAPPTRATPIRGDDRERRTRDARCPPRSMTQYPRAGV